MNIERYFILVQKPVAFKYFPVNSPMTSNVAIERSYRGRHLWKDRQGELAVQSFITALVVVIEPDEFIEELIVERPVLRVG